MGIKAFLRNLKWRYQNLGFQKTNFGTRLKINSFMDHLVFKEIFTDKIYDDFILQSFKKKTNDNDPKKVFDLGANLGFFTVRCCEIWKQLGSKTDLEFVIYEPSETCIGRLKENLDSFDQKPFSFDIRNKLVGKKNGWDWFIEDKDHHLGQCVADKIKKTGHRYSRKIRYHDLSQDLESSKIDLLKCDIEGSEVEFLKNFSSSLEKVCSIIIETHGQTAKDFVYRTMQDIGFDSFQTTKDKDESTYSNLFFVNGSSEPIFSANSDGEKEH
jgi:FkbM family methyltransferase